MAWSFVGAAQGVNKGSKETNRIGDALEAHRLPLAGYENALDRTDVGLLIRRRQRLVPVLILSVYRLERGGPKEIIDATPSAVQPKKYSFGTFSIYRTTGLVLSVPITSNTWLI